MKQSCEVELYPRMVRTEQHGTRFEVADSTQITKKVKITKGLRSQKG